MLRPSMQPTAEPSRKLRVISWNLAHRVGEGSKSEADLIRSLGPDLALLQEANARSIEALAQMAGFDWVRWTKPDGQLLRAGSGYFAAIAGRGDGPEWISPRFESRFPDRVTAARIHLCDTTIMAAAYLAPPGAAWAIVEAPRPI